MRYDTHTHSLYSEDGFDSIDDLCRSAVVQGLAGLCFTDHVDMCHAPIGFAFYQRVEARRRRDFAAARVQYGHELELLWGIELGHPQYLPEEARAILAGDDFDFVLGSVHFLPDGRDLYLIDYQSLAVADEVMERYFEQLSELIRFGGFDSLAHLDYPLRMMQHVLPEASIRRYQPLVERVLREAVAAGVALELNTAGLLGWKKRIEPEPWVVQRYRELGGLYLTIGSDAHLRENIGQGLSEAGALARRCGFEQVAVYRQRRPCLLSAGG